MPPRRSSTRSQARLPQGQTGIQRFTRASKPGATLAVEGKETATTATATAATATAAPFLPTSPSKKRKLNEIGNGESEEGVRSEAQRQQQQQQQLEDAANATPSKTLRFSSLSVSTPRSSRTRQSSESQTSSFESSTTPSGRSSPPTSPSRGSSPSPSAPLDETTVPERSPSPCPSRPAAFYDLLSLHSSFLTAIALHFAHNGASTPADLRELLPSIERIWKKRKVVTRDLQRLIRIWDDDPESLGFRFRIANYGLGKICLERVSRDSTSSLGGGCTAGRFDENELQERFTQNLDRIWRRMANNSKEKKGDETGFVERLGIAPIHDSLTPFTALRKGQQRLQDLKGGVIKIKTAKMKAKANDADVQPREPTTDRRKGLLDRIKSKEMLQAKLPPPPSKEELLRRSAAEHVEDVAKVLALLRPTDSVQTGASSAVTAVQKKPYRFETIIQNVRDSMRNPISEEEVAVCLDILAEKDIAGDWIEIVTVNQLKSVVLKSGRVDVSPREIGAKVAKMKIGWEDHTT